MQTDSVCVFLFLSDDLCLNCEKCKLQNKNMRYINVKETVCTGRIIVITLGLVVNMLDSESWSPVFKTTG